MENILKIENLHINYGSVKALKGISLEINPGEIVTVLGANGAGKSTLVKLLCRIYDPQKGEILVDGVNLKNWNLDALRSQISIIEQDIFLFSRSVADNIAFGKQNVSQKNIEEAAKVANAHDFILESENQYDTNIGDGGCKLSGGQRQRVWIAMALAQQTDILLLDEPTTYLDLSHQIEVLELLKELNRKFGKTIVIVHHELNQAA